MRTDGHYEANRNFLLFVGTCIKSPHFAHTLYLSFNVLFSKQAVIVSSLSVIRLVFVTETRCVYCDVRPFLRNLLMKFVFQFYLLSLYLQFLEQATGIFSD